MAPGGKYARFEYGDTSHFRKDSASFLSKITNIRKIENVNVKEIVRIKEKGEREGGKGKGQHQGANLRFTELENGIPRNTAISANRSEMASEGNRANFTER